MKDIGSCLMLCAAAYHLAAVVLVIVAIRIKSKKDGKDESA